MPKVNLEEIDKLNAVVEIAVTPEDYEAEVNQELKKLATTQSMKGFRKGKTPLSFVKKVYGKGVLSEIVSRKFSDELAKIMRGEEKIKYLGSPLLSKGQPQLDFKPDAKETYSLKFELGKAPEFEVKGLDENKAFTFYKIKVDEGKVDEEYQRLLESFGNVEASEEPIALGSIVKINITELDNDASVKEGGVSSSFELIINDKLSEDFIQAILGKKKGDHFQFNLFNVFKDASPDDIKRNLLKMSPQDINNKTVGESFELRIVETKKLVPAESGQQFFDKVFGEGVVNDEKEAKARIKSVLQSRKLFEGESLLYHEMRNYLIEQNRADMPLPEEFLKRFVKEENAKEADQILNRFDDFLDDLRWDLIVSKLIKKFELTVTSEEVRDAMTTDIRQYIGGVGDQAFLDNLVNRMLQNQDQVRRTYDNVLFQKLFNNLKRVFKVEVEEVEEQQLDEMYAKAFKTKEPQTELGQQTEIVTRDDIRS